MEKEKVLDEFLEEENTTTTTTNLRAPNQEVTLDDLDSVPSSEKFRKVKPNEKIEVKTLTISNVKLGKVITVDEKGEPILPEVNSQGRKYYKSKLILEFEEEVNGDKIREFVPSIFYSVNDDGQINPIPTIPKECPDNKLEDKFTSELSKIRNKYAKFVGKEAKEISSSEFVKGLVGKKVAVEPETGTFKGKDWQKIKIVNFVK